MIVVLESEKKQLRTEAIQFEAQTEILKTQNERLLNAIAELTRAVGKAEIGGRNPNAPNPPAVMVNGKIEKIEKDLVQINLGIDHGLNKNHTLEVYRLAPEPKYLGMIRIVDASQHTSVGRLVGAARSELRVGDLVASRLTK